MNRVLPESYFDGSRLKMYMDILAAYEASSKEEMMKDVKEPEVAMVSVTGYPPEVHEKELFVMEVQNDEEVLCDFSVSSNIGTFVRILETRKQVNRYVSDHARVMRCELFDVRAFEFRNGQWSKHVNTSLISFAFAPRHIERISLSSYRLPRPGVYYNGNGVIKFIESKVGPNKDVLWCGCSNLRIVDIPHLRKQDFYYFPRPFRARRSFLVKIGRLMYCVSGIDFSFNVFEYDTYGPDFIVEGFIVDNDGFYMYDLVYCANLSNDHGYRIRLSRMRELIGAIENVNGKRIFILEGVSAPYVGIKQADNGLFMIEKRGSYFGANRYKIAPHPFLHKVYVQAYYNDFFLLVQDRKEIQILFEWRNSWLLEYVGKVILVEETINSITYVGLIGTDKSEMSCDKIYNMSFADVSHIFDVAQFRRILAREKIAVTIDSGIT